MKIAAIQVKECQYVATEIRLPERRNECAFEHQGRDKNERKLLILTGPHILRFFIDLHSACMSTLASIAKAILRLGIFFVCAAISRSTFLNYCFYGQHMVLTTQKNQ